MTKNYRDMGYLKRNCLEMRYSHTVFQDIAQETAIALRGYGISRPRGIRIWDTKTP